MNLFVAIMVDGFTSDPEVAKNFKMALIKARKNDEVNMQGLSIELEVVPPYSAETILVREKQSTCQYKTNGKWMICCCGCNNNRVSPNLNSISTKLLLYNGRNSDLLDFLYVTLLQKLATYKQYAIIMLNNYMFTGLMNISIFLTVLTMFFGSTTTMSLSLQKFLQVLYIILTLIFTFEMGIKMLALNVFKGTNAYLRNTWNRFDGLLTILSLLDLVLLYVSLPTNRTTIVGMQLLRCSRSLRPLRLIQKSKRMQNTVETLLFSVRPITNICFVGTIIAFIYALLGVQLFQGAFYSCDKGNLDPNIFINITTKNDCLTLHGTWVNFEYNFDNFLNACIVLFVVISRNGWAKIMHVAIDSVGPDTVPSVDNQPIVAVYFVSFILIVSYFVLHMFAGVTVENFQLTMTMDESLHRKENVIFPPAIKPQGKVRQYFYKIVHLSYFDTIFSIIICTNTLVLCLEYYDQPNELTVVLAWLDYIFTILYSFEVCSKIIGTGAAYYFSHNWNKVDFCVFVSAITITFLVAYVPESSLINISVFRVIRVGRIFKILFKVTGIKALLITIQVAAKHAVNLGLLFALIFFIYASVGVELYGQINCSVIAIMKVFIVHLIL